MNLKHNILSNYCSHFYSTFIGITIIPLYFHYLGAAAFGLTGIYVVLQSWLSLLNMGLTPALSREVTCCRDKQDGFFAIKQLLRSVEIIFLLTSLLIVVGVAYCSHWITHDWLKVQDLTFSEVTHCIVIMGVMVSLRLFSDLYRAGISGMEQQVWLNGINVIITTLRYVGAYVLLRWVTRTPSHFFEYQLLIAILEPILLGTKFYKMISWKTNSFLQFKISWELLKKVLPFAGSLFYTAILWIFISQLDKLVLSHVLSLKLYGYFALVTVISGGILQFSMPIHVALLPRMTHLVSQGKKEEMLKLYRHATQVISVIIFSLTGVIAIFGWDVVYVWTGNKIAANWAGPVLFWYAIGNGFFAVSSFQFYLQFVMGNTKLQVVSDTIFTLLSFPVVIFFAYRYGAIGAAFSWFLMRSALFFIVAPIVHQKYARGIHYKWLTEDILPIFLVISIILLCIKEIPMHFELISRGGGFIILSCCVFFTALAGASASTTCRYFFATLIRGIRT